LLFEGIGKLRTYGADDVPPESRWSAQGYLLNASGPFASSYHSLLEDNVVKQISVAPSTAYLDNPRAAIEAGLKNEWTQYLKEAQLFYGIKDEKYQETLGKILEDKDGLMKKEVLPFLDKEQRWIKHYLQDLHAYRAWEKAAGPLATFQETAAQERLRGLQKQRDDYLLRNIRKWNADFQQTVYNSFVSSTEQRDKGYPRPSWYEFTPLDWVNFLTVYGLIGMGCCLLLGLFTRLAALAAVVFFASLYLAMPPWPGLPGVSPTGVEHYLYINPLVIESLAVLAAAGTGRWAGLDALIHACLVRLFFRRTKDAAVQGEATEAYARPAPAIPRK
jgi:uncharacterized membrane protein YphA (DoxX/SURF4 family)